MREHLDFPDTTLGKKITEVRKVIHDNFDTYFKSLALDEVEIICKKIYRLGFDEGQEYILKQLPKEQKDE